MSSDGVGLGILIQHGQIDSLTIGRESVDPPDGMVLVHIENIQEAA